MENKREHCLCYDSGTNDIDGCPYEYCRLYCDVEFDCDMCDHSEKEKYLAFKVSELEKENQEIKYDRTVMERVCKENEQLEKQVAELKQELEQCKSLIDQREHSVADFAVKNSRYVKDLRRR